MSFQIDSPVARAANSSTACRKRSPRPAARSERSQQLHSLHLHSLLDLTGTKPPCRPLDPDEGSSSTACTSTVCSISQGRSRPARDPEEAPPAHGAAQAGTKRATCSRSGTKDPVRGQQLRWKRSPPHRSGEPPLSQSGQSKDSLPLLSSLNWRAGKEDIPRPGVQVRDDDDVGGGSNLSSRAGAGTEAVGHFLAFEAVEVVARVWLCCGWVADGEAVDIFHSAFHSPLDDIFTSGCLCFAFHAHIHSPLEML